MFDMTLIFCGEYVTRGGCYKSSKEALSVDYYNPMGWDRDHNSFLFRALWIFRFLYTFSPQLPFPKLIHFWSLNSYVLQICPPKLRECSNWSPNSSNVQFSLQNLWMHTLSTFKASNLAQAYWWLFNYML